MNASSLRRLATEHRSLHSSALPPNYFFPLTSSSSSMPDDLSQLQILLAGPHSTSYSEGLWRLHLKFPADYPRSPPKAVFKDRIWHPNVDETTGSVCVNTLKRDWRPELTVRDVLVTISCLLIHPNPDSALNATAGQLLQEDYDEFARQATLMTSIHAPVPLAVKDAAMAARRRGEQEDVIRKERNTARPHGASKTSSSSSSVVMKRRPGLIAAHSSSRDSRQSRHTSRRLDESSSDEDEDEASASKENDPSQSPSPVSPAPLSPRKHLLGKRPLSALPTPVDPDAEEDDDDEVLSPSERNIANNVFAVEMGAATDTSGGPVRKSPKLSDRGIGINSSGRIRDDAAETKAGFITPFSDADALLPSPSEVVAKPSPPSSTAEGKENATEPIGSTGRAVSAELRKSILPSGTSSIPAAGAAISGRTVSTASQSSGTSGSGSRRGQMTKPRTGLRRL
ncbi:MAG: hypothetical protein M1817_006818 [Caeruleum heppii]|nr:MAG: hypothetical protein M1817_006818 [Caeruleum heppii]